jgi:hypothetical protein
MTRGGRSQLPPADLQAFVDSNEGRRCFDIGCTTCGGSMGFARIDEWIRHNTRPDTEGRVADLAAALDRLQLTERNCSMVWNIWFHLDRDWFRVWEMDRIGVEVRKHPLLREALSRLHHRIEAEEDCWDDDG